MTTELDRARLGGLRLSVVVATDELTTIAELVRSLTAQTIAAMLELVVVCPAGPKVDLLRDGLGNLGATQVVEHSLVPLGPARAAGVRAARSPVVVVAETHAFPAPDWAEHLVAAHEQQWVAVMPAVVNANADSALSWSAYLVDYGRWAPAAGPAEITDPPPYHASFKREPLLAFDSRLGVLLESGSTLARELRELHLRSAHDPAARISHLNVALPRAWLHERFLGGRLLAAARRDRWSRRRTAVYLAGSPLVPLIRLWRTRSALARASRAGVLPRGTILATIFGCVAWAAGEAVGYASGVGASTTASMVEYELHKARYLGKSGGDGGPGSRPR